MWCHCCLLRVGGALEYLSVTRCAEHRACLVIEETYQQRQLDDDECQSRDRQDKTLLAVHPCCYMDEKLILRQISIDA